VLRRHQAILLLVWVLFFTEQFFKKSIFQALRLSVEL